LNPGVSEGAWVLVVAVLATAAFGLWRAARDGRFRGTHPVRKATSQDRTMGEEAGMSVLDGAGVEVDLGERATLLQFSSAFCAPCRVTRRVLSEVADVVPGIVHVEVDAEHHLELVRRVGVTRTPTTLILDAHGREVSRATGAPKRDEVMATLAKDLV
jgi:thiol-disulfide isomerase/thioredoxin